jgi:hypothetical protein
MGAADRAHAGPGSGSLSDFDEMTAKIPEMAADLPGEVHGLGEEPAP